MSSLSWEKSCYDAVVQLHALLEDNRFTFANIISVMKQLDLSKQSKQTERAQVPAKSPKVAQDCGEREKREEGKSLRVAPNNDLMIESNNNVLLTERANKDEQKVDEAQDEPMEIAENDSREADVSIHEVIVNRMAFSPPDAANKNLSIVNPGPSLQSPTNDPRFFVCTSFAASTPAIISHRETNPGSSFAASSITRSPSTSFRSSQSFQYHDYCLSEREFDITLPSQSTPSEDARMTARAKEAKIFRQIEGDGFDEESFFNDTQVSLKLDLTADDDVVMLAM